MLNILSISDVITNSSSEVFCTISGQPEKFEDLVDRLGDWSSCRSEGGIYEDYEDGTLSIWLDNDFFSMGSGCVEALRKGLEVIVNEVDPNFKITYED